MEGRARFSLEEILLIDTKHSCKGIKLFFSAGFLFGCASTAVFFFGRMGMREMWVPSFLLSSWVDGLTESTKEKEGTCGVGLRCRYSKLGPLARVLGEAI